MASSQTRKSDPFLQNVWARFIGYPKRKLYERRAKYEKESSSERAERRAANATVLIGLFTIVIAIVGIAQWCILSGTLTEMREEQRAWIAPLGIWHNRQKPFVIGDAISYVLEFKNVGKSPASNLKWHIENDFFFIPNHILDIPTTVFSQDDMCGKTNQSVEIGVVFPDTNRPIYESGVGYLPPAIQLQSDTIEDRRKVKVTQKMLDGTEVFYVRGCLTYSTMNIVGKSSFCFFVQPYKGADGSQGNVTSIECRNGNSAE